MEFDNNIPIYIQIMNNIKESMIRGEFRTGDKLPSVREYSKLLRVNPTTIQRVYRELELEGITFTKRGMGSFITEDVSMIETLKESMAIHISDTYIEKMRHIGFGNEDLIQLLRMRLEEKLDVNS